MPLLLPFVYNLRQSSILTHPLSLFGHHVFNANKQKNKGRKQLVRPEDCSGLVLAWTRTRGSLLALQLIFTMTYSILDDYILFGKHIIVMML